MYVYIFLTSINIQYKKKVRVFVQGGSIDKNNKVIYSYILVYSIH